jgi:hypothetical protein
MFEHLTRASGLVLAWRYEAAVGDTVAGVLFIAQLYARDGVVLMFRDHFLLFPLGVRVPALRLVYRLFELLKYVLGPEQLLKQVDASRRSRMTSSGISNVPCSGLSA